MEIDFDRNYHPERIPDLFDQAMERIAPLDRSGVVKVARRLGISRGYGYKLLAGESEGRYPIQVMLERLQEPDGLEVIDATSRYDPGKAPELARVAVVQVGSQLCLAQRMGISRDYVRKLANGQRQMAFGIQVMLEELAARPPP